jgi:hypothetical protein
MNECCFGAWRGGYRLHGPAGESQDGSTVPCRRGFQHLVGKSWWYRICIRRRDDIRTECAGVIAGSWFAGIGKRGEDLIAAGLLMLAGFVDLDELDKWLRVDGSGAAGDRRSSASTVADHSSSGQREGDEQVNFYRHAVRASEGLSRLASALPVNEYVTTTSRGR